MEPPPKPSQQPHAPYIKTMLLPGIGHNRDMSLSSCPGAESSAPQFQEEIHSSSLPQAIQFSSSSFRWASVRYRGNDSSTESRGRCQLSESWIVLPRSQRKSRVGLNAPLWVSQGHGGGSSNSPAWYHSHKYPASPLRLQQIEGNVLRGFSSCWEIAGLRNVL